MRIYKAHHHHPDEGQCLSWHTSKRGAQSAVAEAKRGLRDSDTLDEHAQRDGEPSGVETVDIPNDKKGLIDWLNKNFVRDNG